MAERRMMSKKIVDSDAFMDMALSTQALYFHLLSRADDDGFVGNPKKIMRMVGAGDDEYKVLILKRFILQFSSGVCVIKHWLIHNLIRQDRYSETQYLNEKKSLEVKENKAYTEMTPDVIPSDTHLAPQVRLGKVSIVKDRLDIPVAKAKVKFISKKAEFLNSDYEKLFEIFWAAYPEKKGKGKAYEPWLFLSQDLKEKCITAIKNQNENNHFWKEWLNDKKGGNSYPHATTWLNQKRWDDEVIKIVKTKELETIILISKK